MIIITEISLVICACLLSGGLVQYVFGRKRRVREHYLLGCAITEMERLAIETEKELAIEQEKEEEQKGRTFYLDLMLTHGSAFGGFCATKNDGRRKKGTVALNKIMLYGKHPGGREFSYYIEEEGMEICATDQMDQLLIRSKGSPFEIRQNGQARDEGVRTQSAILQKDILYYVILESKHEISLKAVKVC